MSENKTGFSFYQKENFEKAILNFKKIIEKHPNDFESYKSLGEIYALMFNYEKAIEAFKKAIKINPNFAEVYNKLGVVYAAKEKHDEAIAAFKKAIEIDPDFLWAKNNLTQTIKDKDLAGKNHISIYKQ